MRRHEKWRVWIFSIGLVMAFSINFLRPVVWAVGADTGDAESDYAQSPADKELSAGTEPGSDSKKSERPSVKVPQDGQETGAGLQKNERPSGEDSPSEQPPAAGDLNPEPDALEDGKDSASDPDVETGGQEGGEDSSGTSPDGSTAGDPDTEAGGQEGGEDSSGTSLDGSAAGDPDVEAGGQEGGEDSSGTSSDGSAAGDPDVEAGGQEGGEDSSGTSSDGNTAGDPDMEAGPQEEGEAPGGDVDGELAGADQNVVPEGAEGADPNGPAAEEPLEPQAVAAGANTSGKITLDGSSEDWDRSEIGALSPVDNSGSSSFAVSQWRVARDEDGTVYLCIQGDANEYEAGNAQWMSFSVTQNGTAVTQQVCGIPGGTYQYQCGANGTSKAPFVLEVMIPAEYFTDPNFTITFGGCSAPAEMIPVLDGVEPEPGPGTEPEPPVYSGIGIDGGFQDWSAVKKHDPHDANQCIDQMAAVYDKDVYVYIREVSGGSAAGSGTHSNGKYAVTTDLGEVLLFQLNQDGTISGPAGAEAIRVGSEWEIRIPAEALPRHKQTISVGLYMAEPAVSDMANLSGGGGSTGSFDGIQIDGKYSDWDDYPSTQIQYATAGTQETVTDAKAALYVEGGVLYGHACSTMPAHLGSKGGDFLSAISITFNGDRDYKGEPAGGNFYPVLRRQDGSNEILNEGTRLEDGTYTFEILDHRTVGNNPQVYGTIVLTVNGYQDEMEFTLDLEKVAEYTGMNVQDMKLIEAQFGRLGQEWVSTAGTSSGPWLLVLAAAPAVALLCSRRRREEYAA